jgi:hypothetical protein
MHVVRQDPRMVRSDSDCILAHSPGALPRMWELDLDTVSVGRSCDGNTVRGPRAVCCWALAMVQGSKGLLFSRTLLSVVAMPAWPSRTWTTRRRTCATRCGPEGRLHAIHEGGGRGHHRSGSRFPYVGGTVIEKPITPGPRSIQRSFRIGCATQKPFIRYQKEGRST